MAGVLVITILLGYINNLVNPVSAQDGCISHPLPPEVVDKIVEAANIAISQRKLDSCQTVDGHALSTLAILQHSLSATKEEFSASKMDWENVSSTVTELVARTTDWDNAVASVSSLQSSLSSTKSELAASISNCNNGLTEIQSTLAVVRNELAELRERHKSDISKLSKCKDGWLQFQKSCYFISSVKVTWEIGRQQCLNMGADYVKISTDEEFAFVSSHLVSDMWIGLNDLEEEGNFKWISDGTVHEINRAWWQENQPDNNFNGQDCVDIWFKDGRKVLNDYNCTNLELYMCEMMPEPIIVEEEDFSEEIKKV